MDLQPITPGHSLVVPRRHAVGLASIRGLGSGWFLSRVRGDRDGFWAWCFCWPGVQRARVLRRVGAVVWLWWVRPGGSRSGGEYGGPECLPGGGAGPAG